MNSTNLLVLAIGGAHPRCSSFLSWASTPIALSRLGRYPTDMSTVNQIEHAVRGLAPQDLAAFRAWFAEFEAESWDRQMEEDAAAGRLDRLADEALRDLREGRCTDL